MIGGADLYVRNVKYNRYFATIGNINTYKTVLKVVFMYVTPQL